MAEESPKPKKSSKKVLIMLGASAAVALVVSQGVFDFYVFRTPARADQSVVTNLIISAVEGLNHPAVVEPVSGKAYLPDLKIVLPPYNDKIRDLSYNYMPSVGPNTPAELQITTANVVHAAEAKLWASQSSSTTNWRQSPDTAVFDNVPNLQTCARGIHIFFDSKSGQNDGFMAEGNVKLTDGRTLYIYREHATCQNMDYTDLISYLKQAKSY